MGTHRERTCLCATLWQWDRSNCPHPPLKHAGKTYLSRFCIFCRALNSYLVKWDPSLTPMRLSSSTWELSEARLELPPLLPLRSVPLVSPPRRLEMTSPRPLETGRVSRSLCSSASRTGRPSALWCPPPLPSSSRPSRSPPVQKEGQEHQA